MQQVELTNAVDLVGRKSRLPFQQGRRGVVDAVIEKHEVGPVALLKLASQRDQFLGAHIADLRQVLDFKANSLLVQLPSNE